MMCAPPNTRYALLMGIGGSSLAPEVFRRTFGVADGLLDLSVLDSTDPAAVTAHAKRLDPARTLSIVSTKSGGTVETFSFFRYFYRQTVRALGSAVAGAHFIAITDPGSGLADTAARYKFRATFLNDPNIGGRNSALSHFGLVPAALIGVDLPKLLSGPRRLSGSCARRGFRARGRSGARLSRAVHPGDYVALQAYVAPTPPTSAALADLRLAIRDRLRVATTVGYGPRFLHSTGQLHKGDGGKGVFLQLVTPPPADDVPIPDSADDDASRMTFGVLRSRAIPG